MKNDIDEKLRRKLAKLQAGHTWRIQLAEELLRQVGYTPSKQENGDIVWIIPAHDTPLLTRTVQDGRLSQRRAQSNHSAQAVIKRVCYLHNEGVIFWLDVSENICVSPAELLTAEDREMIRSHKQVVITYLRANTPECSIV